MIKLSDDIARVQKIVDAINEQAGAKVLDEPAVCRGQ